MEANYVEAGSMSIFWTQNRALKTTSLARVLSTVGPTLGSVGPGGSQLLGPKSGSVGPGGSQPFSTWDPTPPFEFYNAN